MPDMPASDPNVLFRFLVGALRSGMDECVCHECGRPWLSRSGGTLCPVCNPSHVGYQPGGASDKPRWLAFWREQLLQQLLVRMSSELEREAQELEAACDACGGTGHAPYLNPLTGELLACSFCQSGKSLRLLDQHLEVVGTFAELAGALSRPN